METRRVISIMWMVWTVLASLLLPGHTQTTVRALVGQDTLLPCVCPPRPPGDHYLVWQIAQHTTVDYAITGTHRDAHRDPQYQNRTSLFYPADNGNCSLLLRRVRVSDAKTYSCIYDHIANITVALEVAAHYSLECFNDSSGEQYTCSANGGFPKGRIYWLRDGQAVEELQGPLSELDILTGLYDITSTLRTGPKPTTLECVVENPTLRRNITADCIPALIKKDQQVGVELKTSLAVSSALLLLLLAAVCITLILRFRRPRCSTKAPVPDEEVALAEVPDAGGSSLEASSPS